MSLGFLERIVYVYIMFVWVNIHRIGLISSTDTPKNRVQETSGYDES